MKIIPAAFRRRRKGIDPESAARLRAARAHAGDPPSVLFFTTHKCASTYISRVLAAIGRHSDYRHVNYASTIWQLGNQIDIGWPHEPFLAANYDRLFRRTGHLYGPQRQMLDFPGRAGFRHILFLRDPRDVLVSSYYSRAFTHALPKNDTTRQDFLVHRERTIAMGLDAYVQQMAGDWLLPLYTDYGDLRRTAESCLYLKYDDYLNDQEGFIRSICDFMQITLPEATLATLAGSAQPVTAGAPELRHKRSGRSGQWKSELRAQTAQDLTEMLAPVLREWGFDP